MSVQTLPPQACHWRVKLGAGLAVGSAEFLGSNEERGWSLAGAAIPVLYIAWSLWLLALGIALIV